MNSIKSENISAPAPQDDFIALTNSIISQEQYIETLEHKAIILEKFCKEYVEQIGKLKEQNSKLKVQFNQLFVKRIVNQQPRSPKPSRQHNSHRLQPYPTNSVQSSIPHRQSASLMQNSNSFQHKTSISSSPQQQFQLTPFGTDQFSSAECLQQPVTDQFYLVTDQNPSHNHAHNLQSLSSQQSQPTAQSIGLTTRSSLLEQPLVENFGLMTENPSHYHIQSPLPQQLLSPSSTQDTNQYVPMGEQSSPYHNTHNLSSPKHQSLVPPVQVTDQFGRLMLGHIPTSQQLTSHMIGGDTYPFQPPEFSDYNEAHKNK
jgi:hypothetical protein